MTWNHRVIKTTDLNGEDWYAIHEVYYAGSESQPDTWTETPCDVGGESIEGLRDTLTRMFAALDKPVLEDK